MACKRYHYFVEGDCEKKLFDSFKNVKGRRIKTGKVEIFNVAKEKLSLAKVLSIPKDTIVVLQYDTDVANIEVIRYNVELLTKFKNAKRIEIIHVISVLNFEDEILRSTSLKNINSLFNTNGTAEFKYKFIHHKDIVTKLNSVSFSLDKMYSKKPEEPFDQYFCDFKNLLEGKNKDKNTK